MRRRPILAAAVLVAALVLCAPWLQARVFRGGGAAGDLFEPGSFGSQIYRTVMQVNGGLADVGVTVCDGGREAVRAACYAYGKEAVATELKDGSLGMGTASRSGKTARWIEFEPNAGGVTLLVSVVQSDAEARLSQARHASHVLADVPLSPDARVLSLMRSQDTRTTLERASSRMTRESLALYHEGAMVRQGWVRMFRTASRPGLSAYLKGADLCWVRIGDTDSNGETRVTVLHKAGAVK